MLKYARLFEIEEGSIANTEALFTFAEPSVPVTSDPVGVPDTPDGPVGINVPAERLIVLISTELRLSDPVVMASRFIGYELPTGVPVANEKMISPYDELIRRDCATKLKSKTILFIINFLSVKNIKYCRASMTLVFGIAYYIRPSLAKKSSRLCISFDLLSSTNDGFVDSLTEAARRGDCTEG